MNKCQELYKFECQYVNQGKLRKYSWSLIKLQKYHTNFQNYENTQKLSLIKIFNIY